MRQTLVELKINTFLFMPAGQAAVDPDHACSKKPPENKLKHKRPYCEVRGVNIRINQKAAYINNKIKSFDQARIRLNLTYHKDMNHD